MENSSKPLVSPISPTAMATSQLNLSIGVQIGNVATAVRTHQAPSHLFQEVEASLPVQELHARVVADPEICQICWIWMEMLKLPPQIWQNCSSALKTMKIRRCFMMSAKKWWSVCLTHISVFSWAACSGVLGWIPDFVSHWWLPHPQRWDPCRCTSYIHHVLDIFGHHSFGSGSNQFAACLLPHRAEAFGPKARNDRHRRSGYSQWWCCSCQPTTLGGASKIWQTKLGVTFFACCDTAGHWKVSQFHLHEIG